MSKTKKLTIKTDDDQEDVIDIHESVADEGKAIEEQIDMLAEEVGEEPGKPEEAPIEELDKQAPVGELMDRKPESGLAVSADPEREFSDPETSKAVDDIVAKETDELLEAEDEARDQVAVKKPKQRGRIKDFFARIWGNPGSRWGIIVGLSLLILLIGFLPASRYAILNTFGVRVSSSIKVIDGSSRQPLKNVAVSLQGVTQQTDQEGMAYFSKMKLGKSELKITKRGFAEVTRSQTLGWGSNPLGETELAVTGTRFSFKLTDFLSGKPVKKSEAISGEFSALGNEQGEISLVVDNDDGTVEAEVTAEGYRTETVTFNATDTTEKTLSMVAGRPQVFVSKRSGKYEVFKIDADGKNETKLLEATGKERDDMALAAHPTENWAALVSTRDGARNKDGYLLSGLFVIDVMTGASEKVNEDERIQLVDWQGDYIIYVLIDEGSSAANPKRSRLMSYNAKDGNVKELASANYFNDVYAANGVVYYAPSSYAVPVNSVRFYKIAPDGSAGSALLDKEVWSIGRSDINTLHLSVGQEWYELKLGATSVTKMSNPPANLKGQSFENNEDGSLALWVDERDGKGVLLVKTIAGGADQTLQTRGGLVPPVRWLNATTVTYRVVSSDETAEYVISINGGEPKKIVDVTNTGSAESFFYY